MTEETKTAIFAGGCFWCTEAIFQRLKGVVSVVPGYTGGQVENPTYEQVCAGDTGHAEAIKIDYDPSQITYEQLLAVFFSTHDPTQLNRQGNDIGTQYRSSIFYLDDKQEQIARDYIAKLESEQVFEDEIVTILEKFDYFYEAENYHRDYYNQNQNKPYCQLVINPKLQKLKQSYQSLLKN